jgi:hypothetical protein
MSLILEGPDGAGKTTLIQELQGHFPDMEVHPRFCTSKEGPIAQLAEAVFNDVRSKPTHFIYDRHPVVSEYIYSAAIPERRINPEFLSPAMGRVRLRVAHHSLMIWCIPPLSLVRANLDEEMPGVHENIERIYDLYRMHHLMWPGKSVVFDYNQSSVSWEALRYALSSTRGKLWKEQP